MIGEQMIDKSRCTFSNLKMQLAKLSDMTWGDHRPPGGRRLALRAAFGGDYMDIRRNGDH